MESTPKVITVNQLTRAFSNNGNRKVEVMQGLDLAVEAGEFLCILGPTGCGKTTLLRILTGLLPPDGGSVQVGGEVPAEGRVQAGVVFQQNSLLPWRRVLQNVTFPLELKGMAKAAARSRAAELLDRVRLSEVANAYPYELSGGMQQRVAIARALAHDTGLLLMDEPFGALDDQTRIVLQRVLLDLWRERAMTVIFITHNIEEALVLGSRVLVLGQGRILHDQPNDLPRPRDPLAPEFNHSFMNLRRTFAQAVGD